MCAPLCFNRWDRELRPRELEERIAKACSAMKRTEDRHGTRHQHLVEPLFELGKLYLKAGRALGS